MKYFILIVTLFVSSTLFSQTLKATDDMALITVHVKNFKGIASIGDKVVFKSKSNGKFYTGTSNTNGTFQILLPEGDSYFVMVMGFEMDNTNNVFAVPSQPGITEGTYTITYELPQIFTLKNLYFDVAKASIRNDSYATLNDLAELMRRKPTMVIEISGHTDSDGDDLTNKRLSEERANSVKKYLISKGIESVRIITVGYGESKPVASNTTEAGKQQNRRTEVKVLHQ